MFEGPEHAAPGARQRRRSRFSVEKLARLALQQQLLPRRDHEKAVTALVCTPLCKPRVPSSLWSKLEPLLTSSLIFFLDILPAPNFLPSCENPLPTYVLRAPALTFPVILYLLAPSLTTRFLFLFIPSSSKFASSQPPHSCWPQHPKHLCGLPHLQVLVMELPPHEISPLTGPSGEPGLQSLLTSHPLRSL